LFWLS